MKEKQLESLQNVKGSVLHIVMDTLKQIAKFSVYQNSCKKMNTNFGILKTKPLHEVWGKAVLKTCFDDMKNVTFKVAHPIHIPNYKYSQFGDMIMQSYSMNRSFFFRCS